MKLIETLRTIWSGIDYPFLIHNGNQLKFSDITAQKNLDLSLIKTGDVVAIIGDFNPLSILTLLSVIDKDAIVVPLTKETAADHEYFFKTALVDAIIRDGKVTRREHGGKKSSSRETEKRSSCGARAFFDGNDRQTQSNSS